MPARTWFKRDLRPTGSAFPWGINPTKVTYVVSSPPVRALRIRIWLLLRGHLRHYAGIVCQGAKADRLEAPRQECGERVDVAADPAIAGARRGFHHLRHA